MIPKTVLTIGNSAFEGCKNLKQIVLPEGLTIIKNNAFAQSGLTSIVIPESVSIVGVSAFEKCHSLKQVTVLGFPKFDIYSVDEYTYYPFEGCSQLTTVIASEEWEKSNYYRFRGSPYFRATEHNTQNVSTQSNGSCYIATAVYGSYDCPHVWTLRRYRDNYLAESVLGRLFIRSYYAISPTIVRWFKDKEWFQKFWRDKLDKKVYKLNQKGYKDTPYSDK